MTNKPEKNEQWLLNGDCSIAEERIIARKNVLNTQGIRLLLLRVPLEVQLMKLPVEHLVKY